MDTARCSPRLAPTIAWISSTITARVVPNIFLPDSEPNRMYNDSGVVTTMCGGRFRMLLRSFCGVSPVRTKVRISRSGRPMRAVPRGCRPAGFEVAANVVRERFQGRDVDDLSLIAQAVLQAVTNQAIDDCQEGSQVFPDPVGAAIRTCRCAWMAGQACSCGAVAASNVLLNQLATAGWKEERAVTLELTWGGVDSLGRVD